MICPKCQGPAVPMPQTTDRTRWNVICQSCNYIGPEADTEAGAVAAWGEHLTTPLADERLLPCPFCKREDGLCVEGTNELPAPEWMRGLYVHCHPCGALGPTGKTEAEAIAAWNTRRTEQTPSPEGVEAVARRIYDASIQEARKLDYGGSDTAPAFEDQPADQQEFARILARAALASHDRPTGCSRCGEMREALAEIESAARQWPAMAVCREIARRAQRALSRASEIGEPILDADEEAAIVERINGDPYLRPVETGELQGALIDESWKRLSECEGPEEIALYWRLQAEHARRQLIALSTPPHGKGEGE